MEPFLKYGAKYGLVGLLLVYLVYFITNTLTTKVDKLVESEQHSQILHARMLDVLEDIRDQKYEPAGVAARKAQDVRASNP